MIKTFCDCCGQEITRENQPGPAGGRLEVRWALPVRDDRVRHELTCSVVTGLDSTANAGHFCKACIIDAVNSVDSRPRLQEHGHIPGLALYVKADGTWLEFRGDKKKAALSIEALASSKGEGIIGTALLEWCARIRRGRPLL